MSQRTKLEETELDEAGDYQFNTNFDNSSSVISESTEIT